MTTIATDGKSMAGDSLINGNGYLVSHTVKVFIAPDGSICGSCGLTDNTVMFRKWTMEGGERPPLSEEFEALILKPDGRCIYMSFKLIEHEYIVPMAIGSGGELAIGAMLAGASPSEAVVHASKRDSRTNSDVTVFHREPKA